MDTSVDKELGRGPRKLASKKHKAVPIAGEHRELLWEQRYAIPISIFIRSVHLTTTGLICPYMIYQGNDTLNFAYPVVNCVFFICWVLVYVPRCIPWVLNRMFSPSKVVFVEVFAAVLWLIDCILIAAKAWDGDCARGTAYYFMGAPQRACEIGKALIALTALLFVCSVYVIWAQRLYWGGPPYNDEEITILQFGGIFRKDIPVEYDRITGLPRRRGARFRDVRYAGIDGSGGGTISGFYGVGSGDGGGGGCGGGDGGGGGCGGGGGGDGGGGGGCC